MEFQVIMATFAPIRIPLPPNELRESVPELDAYLRILVRALQAAFDKREGLPKGDKTYVESNVSEDRTYDADSTSTAELADILGTLITDLRTYGIVK